MIIPPSLAGEGIEKKYVKVVFQGWLVLKIEVVFPDWLITREKRYVQLCVFLNIAQKNKKDDK